MKFERRTSVLARPLRSRLMCIKLNVSIYRTGRFGGIQKASLTHQIELESMQRGICLPAWMGPWSCSPFLTGAAGGQREHPSSEMGCQGDRLGGSWELLCHILAVSFPEQVFQTSQKYLLVYTEGYGLQEAECWPCSFAGQ